MKKYRVEQYELYAQTYEVEAENKIDALKRLFDGQGSIISNGLDFVQVATEYFQPNLFSSDELNAIDTFCTIEDDCVPSIRSIIEI